MRIQVNLGDALQKKVDKYADLCGVTRSAFCAMLVSQGIMAYDKSFEVIDSVKDSLPNVLSNAIQGDKKES